MELYDEAHLLVAAVRVLQYRKKSPPTIEELASSLDLSVEGALATCRKLARLTIIDISEDPFSIKISVANHLEIETLPRQPREEDSLSQELEQFMAKKEDMDKKVDAIQADLKKKRQGIHNDMEERLRREMAKMKKDN